MCDAYVFIQQVGKKHKAMNCASKAIKGMRGCLERERDHTFTLAHFNLQH